MSNVNNNEFSSDTAAEADLLSRLRAGQDDAYEQLVRSYGGQLLSVTRRYLRDEADAQDAVQEAFLSAFKALDRFQGDSKISTWLHRIAINAALMKIRSRQRKKETSIEDLLPSFQEDGHHASPVPAWQDQADRKMERKETQQLVRKCISELPENYRNVLLLRDIEELDTSETATMLGISANAVKIRLHRARQALRELLAPSLSELRA